MFDIYDINCFIEGYKNIWEGKIIRAKDGWFEGIINYPDNNGDINQELFIFGIFVLGIGIRIVEIVPYREKSMLRQLAVGTYLFKDNDYLGIRELGTIQSRNKIGIYNFSVLQCSEKMQENFIRQIEHIRENTLLENSTIKILYNNVKHYANYYRNKIIDTYKNKKSGLYEDSYRPIGFDSSSLAPGRPSKSTQRRAKLRTC